MRGIKAHSGHVGDTGIQAHSCGELFPWMIVGIGSTLVAINGSTGQQLTSHAYDFNVPGSFRQAHTAAEHDVRTLLLIEDIATQVPIKLNVQRVFDQIVEMKQVPTLKLAA